MKYHPTIGLEVHAELKTATKMFCDCPNDPSEEHPNVNTCPICLGHPGALPTINKKAVESMIKIGFAIGGTINKRFKFDRKNYFYPDLPKGYQISQFDEPVVAGGSLDVSARIGEPKMVQIDHVHLEEDAGKLAHASDGTSSLVDFNRGGVPLMELVTKPDMHSVKEAVAFARELQLILRYLGVSDADLEHGQMRADANISMSPDDSLGTKVEIKNLNSFSAIEAAILHEMERQTEMLEAGERVKQETRGWDDIKQKTVSQRSKEEAQDYRYFPEPDLPPLDQSAFDMEVLRSAVPELPQAKRERLAKQYELNSDQVNLLIEDRDMAEYFEEAVSEWEADLQHPTDAKQRTTLFNYLNTDLRGLMANYGVGFKGLRIAAENFADLMDMLTKNEISSRTGKDLLVRMYERGIDPRDIVKDEGLGQVSDESGLVETVRKVIAENPKAVEDFRKGKTNALQFMVGKSMAALKGRGNPGVLQDLFKKELG
ncbi:MAG: Asp-tRNA(Asn)/Glu-tRNA(Gln) amidotransferase subunit GatB [Patescibacteria group bacterium]|nr:Asp-tRNA(Asn)/Glu-tRNA(Gln) amidotransferase subunit GatB [Patescibacteria group bacterium]